MIKDKSLVIWDWNGTLLNDASVCIVSMNHMLTRRGMPPLDVTRYREVFTFPVQDYYVDLGFDFTKENFKNLSVEFIEHYRELQVGAGLHDHAWELLQAFRNAGMRQVILSAMERSTLIGDITARGIAGFFDEILGVDDHYANGKAEIALEFLSASPVNPEAVILLGDTRHDFEVATLLGCECILVANGHHSYERLRDTGALVQKNLAGVLNLLINP